MSDQLNFQLVDSKNQTNDFNTIDLQKLDLDFSQGNEIINLSEDVENPKNENNEILMQTRDSQYKPENYDTLKEPLLDTLVI